MRHAAHFGAALALACLAAGLSGCAVSDDRMAHLFVTPDKYAFYTCSNIAKEAQAKAARERELEQLMAKANVDAGGQLVSSIAYRPDYLTARGEMNELRAAAAAKHCDFVPGAAGPSANASEAVVR